MEEAYRLPVRVIANKVKGKHSVLKKLNGFAKVLPSRSEAHGLTGCSQQTVCQAGI